jgi:predicted RNA-binding protein with PUA-like domain
MKSYWLLKTEPDTYSIDDLKRDKKTAWSGVRNYQARNNIRAMQKGDMCLVYHTGDEKAVVGVAKVVSAPYAEAGEWTQADVSFVKKFKTPVPLVQVKHDPSLRNMVLVHNSRLSVQPVTEKEFDYILELASQALQ